MSDDKVISLQSQSAVNDPLSALLREKASELLQAAINAECAELLAQYAQVRDRNGMQAVVRNGYLPERAILTGLGPVALKVRRVKDRTDQGIRFESKLVPHYVRRAASVDAVLPRSYLCGISQADIGPALEALIGPGTGNLSSGVISRLKQTWAAEYAAWNQSDLSKERWVYAWADGVYSGIRAEDHRLCALVAVGVNERGHKRFLAIEDGVRESKQSWREVLIGSKQRGMQAPMEFWAALEEVFAETGAATLLGAQDGQCAQLPAQIVATQGEKRLAGDLDGRHAGTGNQRVRCFLEHL